MDPAEEKRLEEEAVRFLKMHVKDLIQKFAASIPEHGREAAVSIFLAGSPGAGKTEFSKGLVQLFPEHPPLRIDADEIRAWLPGYRGEFAHVFQAACTIGVDKLHDYALDHHLSFILDGTFAYKNYRQNMERSLKRGRTVEIYYLYQPPEIAWDFTQKREAVERRRVSKAGFIEAFVSARENVREAKNLFGDRIKVHVMVRNLLTGEEKAYRNVANAAAFDAAAPRRYTRDELEKMII